MLCLICLLCAPGLLGARQGEKEPGNAKPAQEDLDRPATPPDVEFARDDEAPPWTAYPHGGALALEVDGGPRGALLFEPLDPRPEEAPLVVFLHGWAAFSPAEYGAWIHHLVRQGNVVVFPHWQDLVTLPGDFLPNAVAGLRAACERAQEPDRIPLDLSRVAFVGHSMGGLLAANLAAVAADESLPVPGAVFCVQPGLAATGPGDPLPALEDLARIPAHTLLVTLASEQDDITGNRDAKRILRAASAIPWTRKDYVFVLSDDHGRPGLRADHLMPMGRDPRYASSKLAQVRGALSTRRSVDVLDVYALWKPFDRMRSLAAGPATVAAAAFEGLDFGDWSDGTPVETPLVLDLGG